MVPDRARRAGRVSRPTVARAEAGQSLSTISLVKVADALGLTVQVIVQEQRQR